VSGQYATFEVAGHSLGINVLDVQEVLRDQKLTPVPLAPTPVVGLINLRGQIIPALEMRRMLRLPDRPEGAGVLSVVIRAEGNAVSLQVDEIGDVLELDAGSLESPPRNLEPHVRDLLSGVHKLEGRLLLVLDTRRAACSGEESEEDR
jgi:purine-binding chemotaxis protein CheW